MYELGPVVSPREKHCWLLLRTPEQGWMSFSPATPFSADQTSPGTFQADAVLEV